MSESEDCTQAPQAVLRPAKQPLWDTVLFSESGLVGSVDLFSDVKWFPDHTAKKFGFDTNMLGDGCLPVPCEYDFSSLELRFEKYVHPEDIIRVLRGTAYSFVRGQVVKVLELVGSAFKPLLVLPHEAEDVKKYIDSQLQAMAERGEWESYTHAVVPIGSRALRIRSSESFRLRVTASVGELHGPVRLKVSMQDTLHTPL